MATRTRTLNNLKVLSINVNSIVANRKRSSLFNIIDEQKPDIVCLSETKLKKNHVINFTIFITLNITILSERIEKIKKAEELPNRNF